MLTASASAASPVIISEFLASNRGGLRDMDGDRSDWIELANTSSSSVDLAGWRLTDDVNHSKTWKLPATNLPSGGFLVVFASGKDRAVVGQELHTDFQLAAAGEHLALIAPDGTIATEFAPTYPPQSPDVAYGTAREALAAGVLPLDVPVRVLIPQDDTLARRWTGGAEPFDDSGWLATRTGVGFDRTPPSGPPGPLGYWSFDDVGTTTRAADSSGHGHTGTVSGALYTADRTGHTLRRGDRALGFFPARNSHVRIPDAASGVFDSATTNDALTVSLWVNGSAAQPVAATAFWFAQNADGSGARAAQVHLPWSDRTIYWDTANNDDCCGPAARATVSEPDATKWRGAWNHYVFLKRGPEKEIWQNGALLLRATGASPLTTLRSLTIGATPGGAGAYSGSIDDFAFWDRALGADEIQALSQGGSPLSPFGFAPLLNDDLGAAMAGVNASAYLRLPFTLDALPDHDSLRLRIQHDDGFVAYLNGGEVARRNAPALLAWDSAATASRSRAEALRFDELDLPGAAALLRVGTNVLAIHGLNRRADDPDFLVRPELLGLRLTPGRFLPQPTPGSINGRGVLGLTAAPVLDQPHGFQDSPFDLRLAGATPGAKLAYTTNGSAPSPTNGRIVTPLAADRLATATVPIRSTTIVRAVAFRDGFEPSPITTRTYLFLADIARQPVQPSGLPTTWPDGAVADYEVDPEVMDTALPGYGFADAIRSLPVVSLVADPKDLFDRANGIYANAGNTGDAWERAASAEWIPTAGEPDFQIDCGVQIHGGISRRNDFTQKHSFALQFKRAYGPAELDFPLFPGSPVRRFDHLVLKGLSTDTWPVVTPAGSEPPWHPAEASYHRDQWVRDSQLALGQPAARGRYVHLFLNGLYWGLYNLDEHPDAAFQADHLGGRKEDYDTLKDFAELDSGDLGVWNEMLALARAGLASEASYQRIQGNAPDGTRDPAYPRYLDVDNLIDYMLLHIFIGATDWPNHNWWAGRRRGPESEGFRFFPWDQDISLNSLTRTTGFVGQLFAEVSTDHSPALLYDRLRQNPSFRLRFADHIHRHLFNGGALTPAANEARWLARAAEIDRAVVAESARWGDARRAVPYKREVEWLANERWMREQFWPKNHGLALGRLRAVGLYPNVAAPRFSQHGGAIPAGFRLDVLSAAGTTFYTLDGRDPRTSSGGVSPTAGSHNTTAGALTLTLDASRTVKARVLSKGVWSALTEAAFQVRLPLAITELMFHPSSQSAAELARAGGRAFDADDYEFIELQNLSADRTLDLRGVRFTVGVELTFGEVALAPLERAVVVRDRVAFANRYGTGPRVIGTYGDPDPAKSSKLSDNGERVTLVDASGAVIADFIYSDAWYPEVDGAGRSLELVAADLPLSERASWRASLPSGGTPGSSRSVAPLIHSFEIVADALKLGFMAEAGVAYAVEHRESLFTGQWATLEQVPAARVTGLVTLTVPRPTGALSFYRLVAR